MGKTNEDLRKSCAGAILKDGKRFAAGVGESELKNWIENGKQKGGNVV